MSEFLRKLKLSPVTYINETSLGGHQGFIYVKIYDY